MSTLFLKKNNNWEVYVMGEMIGSGFGTFSTVSLVTSTFGAS
jgi:high-affinity nickel permease